MWSLAGSQADLLLWAWVMLGGPIQLLWAWVARASGAALGLSHLVLGSAVLGLWVGQLASAPDAHPPEVSGVGALPGFQVWAPSPLICVRTTGLQVNAGAVHCTFTVQGLRWEGRQRLWLLWRVL